jgi:hypothetical protein
MTGYWNTYKLDIPMAMVMAIGMAMAMVMMSSKRKPPWIPPSQDEAHNTVAGCGFHTDYCV